MAKPGIHRLGRAREIAAFCDRLDDGRVVVESMKPDTVRTCYDWNEFEAVAAHSDCAVAAVRWLDNPSTRASIREIKRRAPDTPVVIVTEKDFGNLRFALQLSADDVVGISDVSRDLSAAVSGAIARTYLTAVATSVENARHLPLRMRIAFGAACRSREPIHSVRELASLSGVSSASLWRSWRAAAPAGLTSKGLLDWVILLRAASRKSGRVSWEFVAEDLSTDEDTLRRITKRLMGAPLSQIGAETLDVVREHFQRAVLAPLGIHSL